MTSQSMYGVVLAEIGRPDEFLEVLRRRLSVHGITHAAVAMRAGIDPSRLSRYMNRRRTPNLETCLRLDEAADKLIYGE